MPNKETKEDRFDNQLPNGSWGFLDKAPEPMSDKMKKYIKRYFEIRQRDTKQFKRYFEIRQRDTKQFSSLEISKARQEVIEEVEALTKELGSDPPLESNERRRGYHQAFTDMLQSLITKDK